MFNRILASTALALILGVSGGAYAQTAGGATTSGSLIMQQQSGEMLAEDIIGANVRNAQNESIGSVSDLILDQNGQLKGAVISVGGFLGIGDKKVAVPWNAVKVGTAPTAASGSTGGGSTGGATSTASQDPVLMVNMTKEELKSAAPFKTVAQQQRETERASRPAPSGAPATAPGTSRPATSPTQ
jgi:sporulation protein YlmC with PRC-barrel domain